MQPSGTHHEVILSVRRGWRGVLTIPRDFCLARTGEPPRCEVWLAQVLHLTSQILPTVQKGRACAAKPVANVQYLL